MGSVAVSTVVVVDWIMVEIATGAEGSCCGEAAGQCGAS